MTQIIQKLLGQLERLPVSLQDRYVSRWMNELAADQGDDALQKAEPQNPPMVNYEDIKHLIGRFEGTISDLSSNPKYMEGFGEKLMGRK